MQSPMAFISMVCLLAIAAFIYFSTPSKQPENLPSAAAEVASAISTKVQLESFVSFHQKVSQFELRLMAAMKALEDDGWKKAVGRESYFVLYEAAFQHKQLVEQIRKEADEDLIMPALTIEGAEDKLTTIRGAVLSRCDRQIKVAQITMDGADVKEFRPSQITQIKQLNAETALALMLEDDAAQKVYLALGADPELIDFKSGFPVSNTNVMSDNPEPAEPARRVDRAPSTDAAAQPDDTADDVEAVR